MTGSHWRRSGSLSPAPPPISSSTPQSFHLSWMCVILTLTSCFLFISLLLYRPRVFHPSIPVSSVRLTFNHELVRLGLIQRHKSTLHKWHHTHTHTHQQPCVVCLLPYRAPTNSSTVVHLLPLPYHSKADGVHLRWTQEAPQGPEGYESCWGLDNVLLVNAAHKTPLLEDNLDPPDTANWLFFPGATVKVQR